MLAVEFTRVSMVAWPGVQGFTIERMQSLCLKEQMDFNAHATSILLELNAICFYLISSLLVYLIGDLRVLCEIRCLLLRTARSFTISHYGGAYAKGLSPDRSAPEPLAPLGHAPMFAEGWLEQRRRASNQALFAQFCFEERRKIGIHVTEEERVWKGKPVP